MSCGTATETAPARRCPRLHDLSVRQIRRELDAVTHIPGDLSAAEIEARYQAALRAIEWRRLHP